jgi:sugar-specific transcriptional regulator TrmB
MTALFQDLQSLGLTENQVTTYLALARTDEAKAGELIKKTGLHRNIVYTALEYLLEKKLITQSYVRGVAVYKTLSPDRFLSAIQEKKQIAERAIEEIKLLSKKSTSQEVILYEGLDEFRRHTRRSFEISKPGATIRYLGTSPRWHSVVDEKTAKELITIQKQKKLRLRGIAKAHFPEMEFWLRDASTLTELRYNLLVGSDTNNIEILEDRICIQSFVEPYLVIEILNKEMAKNYQGYFDFLWSKSK